MNTDDSTNTTYNWTVYLDESDFSAQSNKTLVLAPGSYEFNLLLTSGTRQYAGSAAENIIDGENDVAMTIRPVIGETITDVTLVDSIFDLKFQYDTSELSDVTTPQLGILIDSDPTENLLTINPSTGLSNTYISIAPGTHNLKLKFYDGSTQRGRSIPEQEVVNVALGNNITLDIVPLQGETTFTLTEGGEDAIFRFNIPSEVVDEAGGIANLEALFSITSTVNGFSQVILPVVPNGEDYSAETILSGYQYDTVDLMLTFTQISDSKQIAECLNEAVVLDVNLKTIPCDITLRRDGIIGGNLLATLGVNVMNTGGEPVAGASVYANGELIGITGSGTFGTPGYLRSFLLRGDYLIRAEDTTKFEEQNISLAPLEIKNIELVLSQPLDTTPPYNVPETPGIKIQDVIIYNDINYTNNPNLFLDLSAQDNVGVTDYFLIQAASTPPTPNMNDDWVEISPVTTSFSQNNLPFTLTGDDEEKKVYVWYRDQAGNISLPAEDSINFDATPPENLVVEENKIVLTPQVMLDLLASDEEGVRSYFISESSSTPQVTSNGWVNVSPVTNFSTQVTFSLNSSLSSWEVYIWFKDVAENISVSKNVSVGPPPDPPIARCGDYDVYDIGSNNYLASNINNGSEWNGDVSVAWSSEDTILGSSGPDLIVGMSGDHILRGQGGDDLICGSDGVDLIYGDGGNDTIYGNGGNDHILGDTGEAWDGKVFNNVTYGVIKAIPSENGADGSDLIYGNEGDDYLRGENEADEIHGGTGADIINGNEGRDTIYGDAGIGGQLQTLKGGVDNDTIYGGSDRDIIYGDQGNDVIRGGSGNDDIYGDNKDFPINNPSEGNGADTIYGENGNDKIWGQEGDDWINGGSGNDDIYGDMWELPVYYAKTPGNDVIYGEDGVDNIRGEEGHDEIHAGPGADFANGNTGNDLIFGDDGDDELRGGADQDSLYGGNGNDILLGNLGNDALSGDGGTNDTCDGGDGSDISNPTCETNISIP